MALHNCNKATFINSLTEMTLLLFYLYFCISGWNEQIPKARPKVRAKEGMAEKTEDLLFLCLVATVNYYHLKT